MSQRLAWLLFAALVGHLLLGLWMMGSTTLNGDEGWYLYAGSQMAQGAVPYRDLLLFQAPMMPAVYGSLVGSGAGVIAAARWVSVVFLALSVGLMVLSASRLGGRIAGLVVALTVGLHPLVVANGVLAKPYALTLFLCAGAVFMLSGGWQRPLRVFTAMVLLVLAVGTRVSVFPALLVFLFSLRGVRLPALLGMCCGALILLPRVWGASAAVVWEQVFGWHLAVSPSPGLQLAWVFNVVMAFGVLFALACVRPGQPKASIPGLGLAGLAVLLVHLSPRALHVEHAVAALPFLGVWVGVRVSTVRWTWPMGTVAGVLWVAGNQVSARWVHLDGGASLVGLEQVAERVAARTPVGPPLLTVHTAVALTAERSVPAGFEMGPFGIDEQHVRAAMKQPVGGVLLAPGDLAQAPGMDDAVGAWARAQFPAQHPWPRFGQFAQPITLYSRPTGTLELR